jgi:response regulator RpfG family c-di-GMP phosphodiesterase
MGKRNVWAEKAYEIDCEWAEIKHHPEIGYRILNTGNDMADTANYVLYHHLCQES